MSHMVESLAYAGETPWHGLGVHLMQRLSATDMLKVAGLDWTVESRLVKVEGETVEGYQALVRVPHGNTLAILGDGYGIVQNSRLAELAEAMAGEGVQMWEVAGSLDEGKRVFFCGVLGSTEIAGDEVARYLTLASSHDTTLAVTAGASPIRVVCNNTLQAFLGDTSPRFTVRHTKRADDKVKVAIEACKRARAYFGRFEDEAVTLVGHTMSVLEACEVAEHLFPTYRSEDTGRQVVPALQTTAVELFKGQRDSGIDRRIAGTRWGFYQAVTAALDHNRKGSQKSKLARFLTGSDDSIRSKAWALLTGKRA